MLFIAYYFLKVIAVSGVLMFYYRLFLFNKKFHSYNRFYLLFTVLFSWLIPFVIIYINKPTAIETVSPVYQFVNIIADNNSEIENMVQQPKAFSIDWEQIAVLAYATVSIVLLVSIVGAFVKMYQLLKSHSCKKLEDIYLIITNVKGTPFSFFKYIFWNEAIQLNTEAGKQILQHELVHVKEKHSINKLIMQLVLLIGWANPFFWWAKKELEMIHEFIADNKSIEDGNANKLAAMLLAASYPQHQYLLSNPFFFSPIKRRLSMLTNTKNPKLSYARRIIVLPILAITILFFAFRTKAQNNTTKELDKVYTVVIDAGHGGTDFGASGNNAHEKDIALAIAKKVLQQNNNGKIKIVLSRAEDELVQVKDRTAFAKKVNADLFVSIHTDWSPTGKEYGMGVYIPNADRKGYEQCVLLANAVGEQMKTQYNYNGVRSRTTGVWVLQKTECPAIMIEAGFISNAKDFSILKNDAEQTTIAKLILKGVESYLNNAATSISKINVNNKVPKYGDLLWSISSKQTNEIIGKEKFEGAIVRKIWGDSLLQFHIKTDTKTIVTSFKKIELLFKENKLSKKLYDYCAFLDDGWRLTYDKEEKASLYFNVDSINFYEPYFQKMDLTEATFIIDGKVKTKEDALNLIKNNQVASIGHFVRGKKILNKSIHEQIPELLFLLKGKKESNFPLLINSPLANATITQNFGQYIIPNSKIIGNNDGILISSKTDYEVKAIDAGTIVYAGEIGDEKAIIVKKDNLYFSYSYLENLNVTKGETIEKGKTIGNAKWENNGYEVLLTTSNDKGNYYDPLSLVSNK